MDIARPSNLKQKRIKRAIYGAIAVLVVGGVTFGLSRLKPAAPTVEARDALARHGQARARWSARCAGSGTLVPEDIRWIPATTQGRVERIILRPGHAR